MQILNYFLASIISYLGIALGIILIYIAPEEQKQGKRYFSFLRYIFFAFIILFLLFYYYKNIFIILFTIIFSIVFLLLNHRNRRLSLTKVRDLTRRFLGCQKSLRPTTKVVSIAISKHNKLKIKNFKKINKLNDINKSLIIYFILAIIFYLSYRNINLFIIESSLIFLYGAVNASSLFDIKRKNYMEILLKHTLFMIITLALFIVF